MLYLKQYNLGFVHIPKTGGTSIRNWLSTQGDTWRGEKHGNAKELLAKFPTAKYFVVCRNPYARLVSWYNFRIEWHNKYGPTQKIPLAAPGMTNDKALKHFSGTFDDWLNRIDFEKPVGHNWDFAGIQKQKSYLDMSNPPSYILRQENLNKEIEEIRNILGIEKPVSKINTS